MGGRFGGLTIRRAIHARLGAAVAISVLVLLAGVGLLMAGCDPTVGEVRELVIDEPFVAGDVVEVGLSLQLGSLTLSPGASGLVSGTVQYNVEDWKPDLSRSDDSLIIQQGSTKQPEVELAAIVNDWDLMLGQTPMNLDIDLGEVDCSLELGGLSVLGLDLRDGGAQTQVTFGASNPSQMERFRYRAGATTVSLKGLANANPDKFEFTGSGGTYSFDFSGALRSDTVAEITVTEGTVNITVPAATRAQVKMKGTAVDLVAQGAWTIEGSTYSTPALAADDGGRTLTIELEMTGGSATLICE